MVELDLRTVLFGYALSNAVCLAVGVVLWRVGRGRFPGPGWWLADYVLQCAALALFALRGTGVLPEPFLILTGIPLVVGGTILLYVGLERFVGRRGPHGGHALLLGAVIVGQVWFGLVKPSLLARNVLFSLALLAICGRGAWLLLRRVEAPLRRETRATGVVLGLYALFSVARVASYAAASPGEDFLRAGLADVLAILAYQILFVALTFGLTLMVTGRLQRELEHEVAERARAEGEVRALNESLEARVRERTAEVEASLRDLEELSATISHDLRGPLRAVAGFSRILREEHRAGLDEEGRQLCASVTDSAAEMGRLIDDLLAYARLGRAPLTLGRVDMAALATEAFEAAASPERRGSIDLRLRDLPPATGDAALLRLVWKNLLANAVKFTAGRERAVIEIGAGREGGEVVYSVRDNGVGFDMRLAGKLFGMFERLHAPGEFDGRGAGLAIVRRIVARHGGRVWAESDPGAGAVFHFTLGRDPGERPV